MPRVSFAIAVALGIIVQPACSASNSSTPGGPTPVARRVDVSDPAGDAVRDPRLTTSPDLLSARAEVVGGAVVLRVQVAPGSYDSAGALFAFHLDTDENAATGLAGLWHGGDETAIGTDYIVLQSGAMMRCTGRTADACQVVLPVPPRVTQLPDGVEVTVDLALLGGDDGRLSLKVTAWSFLLPSFHETATLDVMPNEGLPPVRLP